MKITQRAKAAAYDAIVADIADTMETRGYSGRRELLIAVEVYDIHLTRLSVTNQPGMSPSCRYTEHPTRGQLELGQSLKPLADAVTAEQTWRRRAAEEA